MERNLDHALGQMLDERAITKVMHDYTRFVDFGQAEHISELFADDGVWEGPGVVLEGGQAIHRFFAERAGVTRRTSRHVITNIAIEHEGHDEATALSYLINFRHDSRGAVHLPVPAGHPKYVGEYNDRFVRTAQGWRFQRRVFTNTFLRPPAESA